ncbi:MAG: hypothetical protein U1E62_21035 [Alsobacter sp.]
MIIMTGTLKARLESHFGKRMKFTLEKHGSGGSRADNAHGKSTIADKIRDEIFKSR